MKLDPASWLDKAKALPLNGKSVTSHDCGSGRKLIVEHKPKGYSAWCHRCGLPGWVPKAKPPLAERIAELKVIKDREVRAASTIKPPMPAVWDVKEWPDEAKVWLYKAGIDNDWIRNLGFYWAPSFSRVVIPFLNDQGSLEFWQARGFNPDLAKYLNPPIPEGGKPLYKAPRHSDRSTGKLVLTEDILSAIKCGLEPSSEAWSILGTRLTDKHINEIISRKPTEILVWLDPDEAGVKGRRTIVRQLRSLGLNARGIRADLDPKAYPIEEIRRKLCI